MLSHLSAVFLRSQIFLRLTWMMSTVGTMTWEVYFRVATRISPRSKVNWTSGQDLWTHLRRGSAVKRKGRRRPPEMRSPSARLCLQVERSEHGRQLFFPYCLCFLASLPDALSVRHTVVFLRQGISGLNLDQTRLKADSERPMRYVSRQPERILCLGSV